MFFRNLLFFIFVIPLISNSQYVKPNQNKGLPPIDFTHWKVTLPIGAPTEVGFPDIMNYGKNELLTKYMYNDSSDGSVVFYAFPGATTSNTSHSRCELREQMEPGQNTPNWTFAQGGRMKGTLAMGAISKDNKGNYHKTIIMQIHGRLTEAQRILIGQKDNNAPPVLKISWEDGKVFVRTKVLKDTNTSDKAILTVDAWKDEAPYVFKQAVGFDKFTLEVKVSDGRLEVILNNNESVVFDGFHKQKWGVFENYFKAGNYLQTTDANAYAKVKYYSLEVSH